MKTTKIVIIVMTLILLMFEVYLIESDGVTVSEYVWSLNDRTVSVAFALGLICGHFFWPRVSKG